MNRTDFLLRLRALFLRKQVEQDLDEEVGFHIEMQTRKNLAAGMSAAEARRQASIQFGRGDAVKEECRDARRVGFMETLIQDIRYALRGFCRTPLFALTVVGIIALGLGWNTAVFTIFNAYVLRPLAVHDPYSLYDILWTDRSGHGRPFTWQQYKELSEVSKGVAQVAAVEWNVSTRMNGRYASGQLVDGDFFSLLGIRAAAGRLLTPQDARSPGLEPVVVLSYDEWLSQFGGTPGIVGQDVSLHGRAFTVVGVAPEGFTGVGTDPRDFWAPITMSPEIEEKPDLFGVTQPSRVAIVARLKPGEKIRQAQAALTAWAQATISGRDASERATGIHMDSLATVAVPQGVWEAMLPIAAAFLLVLLSACANVANMMLARAMSRQREIGIRLSLGAARGRLIRQLLTESVLLAVPSAGAGLLVSQGIIGASVRLLFATLPAEFAEYLRLTPLTPDVRVFGFMIGAAVASALLFGLAPAMQVTRMNVMQAARGDFSSEFRPSRLRNTLVVAQVAVCAFLLICSGVLLRGSDRLKSLGPRLPAQQVVEIEIQERSRLRAIAKIAAFPEVEMIASTSNPPIALALPTVLASANNGFMPVRAAFSDVSPEYFSIFSIPLLRGRDFTPIEAISALPVAIVSESTAHELWPNGDALGQPVYLKAGGRLLHDRSARVVGVVRDTIGRLLGDPEKAYIYLPASLQPSGGVLLARVRGDTEAARQRLNAALEDGDPGAVIQIHKMQEFETLALYPFRAAYWVSVAVGFIGLLLTLSGIYGVLAYVVAQRTKEIGIRVAMGATTRAVIGLVLMESTKLAARGVGLGVVVALGASKLFSAQMVINPFDGVAYLGGMLSVLAACICAAYFPARRAARVDPITTLRYD